MKTKSALLTIAAILAFTLTGQTKNNRGTIIVYRPWSLLGAHITNWRFNLNHGPDLMVRNGTYYTLTVLAGESIISHDNMPFIEEDSQTVQVYPGQIVYFQYTDEIVLKFKVADDQEQAARTVSKLRPMEKQLYADESFND